MRTYERNGVHVDQCTECRGIFLDRGELDRLIDAENAWHGEGPRPREDSRDERHRDERHRDERHGNEYRGDDYRDEYRDSRSQHRGSGSDLGAVVSQVLGQVGGQKHSSQYGYPKRKKKESFLSDLFG
jgi:Zn-finger nucleic acid-binding protein